MRRWKQGLASILAVLMLVSALPATALAVEEEEGQAPVLTQEDVDRVLTQVMGRYSAAGVAVATVVAR